MAVGRKFKNKSGVVEVQDIIVHGKIYLEGGKIVLQAKSRGAVGNPSSLQIKDGDEVTVLELTNTGDLKLRGELKRQ